MEPVVLPGRYLLVNTIPSHRVNGEVLVDPLWAKDLAHHAEVVEELTLAAPVVSGPPPRDAVPLPPKVRHVDLRPDPAPNIRALWREIRRADLVHVTPGGRWLPLGWVAAPLARLAGRRLVTVIDSAPWRRTGAASRLSRVRARGWEAMMRWIVRIADVPVYTQPEWKDSLGRGRGHVVPASWIDDDHVLGGDRIDAAWTARHARGTLDVAFAAKLGRNKGVGVLLDAARILDRAGHEIVISVYGDGPMRDACEAAARDLRSVRLQLKGTVPYGAEFSAALGQHDLVVIPNLSDEQPRLVFDAYALALPVLCSGTPGLRSVVSSATGWLVPPGDAGALAAVLGAVTRSELEARGRAAARQVAGRTHTAMHETRARLLAGTSTTTPQEQAHGRTDPGTPLRAIAFYLPQFHPIPENDEWWGRGFTEWTNVAKAKPLRKGHYQPHLPADLGFYDLRQPESRSHQAALAREHGIHGFCYWHYWFNGRRVLERPFTEVLRSGEPDFPFMLCWANENWTRTWDGGDSHQLLTQEYSSEDDRAHIRSLFPAFADDRYIRVDGRPVFGVYRTNLIPDMARTAATWREEARRAGIGGLYLVRIAAHEAVEPDPADLGMDAALEFQPDVHLAVPRQRPAAPVRALNRVLRPDSSIRHHAFYRYEDLVAAAIERRRLARPPWTVFPGLVPGWDNSPRRARASTVFLGSTPQLYRTWLQSVVTSFVPPTPDENLIFINAWNEWAEGNHLEPDQRWGRAYLEATRAVLAAHRSRSPEPAADAAGDI